MPLATTVANAMLATTFGGGANTNIKLALYTVAPTNYLTGTGGTECADANYTRATVANNPTNFPAPVNRKASNGTKITITATGFTANQNIVAWGMFDNANAWMGGAAFANAIACGAGQPVYFDIGDIVIEFT